MAETWRQSSASQHQCKPEEYEVSVDPQLIEDIESVLRELNIQPLKVPKILRHSQTISLTPEKKLEFDAEACPHMSGAVSWSPPQPNWNPWYSSNIEERPLADLTIKEISVNLQKEYMQKMTKDKSIRKMLKVRKGLPVTKYRKPILRAIRKNKIVIIRGATGCGKTTQVPQYLLDNFLSKGEGADCNIIITQPRRISAISVAERIAEERAESLGKSTGYSVRFDSCFPRPYGSILVCTVGVLLRKLESGLRGITHIIVDEIHERGVDTDFLLIVLRDLVQKYPQLRLIIMSATVNAAKFHQYFGYYPVIEVSGKTFEIKEHFLEDCIKMVNFNTKEYEEYIETENMKKGILDAPSTEQVYSLIEEDMPFELIKALLLHIKENTKNSPGAILVFLPGWNTIFALMSYLQGSPLCDTSRFCILPLHSQVKRKDQLRVFEPVSAGVTKIILATNIAESGITISDVVYVIDSCTVKNKTLISDESITDFSTEWASKANLEQRKGRAGRVGAGAVFRLCTRARFDKLQDYHTPEILLTPLHELALSIKLLGLGDIEQFLKKAMDPPPIDAIIQSEVFLKEMGALNRDSELTHLGKILARLPVEPRLGKMLVLACVFYCGDALCTIAANCSTLPEPFDTSMPERLANAHKKFCGNRYSDHLTMLNAFEQWEEAYMRSETDEHRFCKLFSLCRSTLRITHDARNQLKDILLKAGFPKSSLASQSYDFEGRDSDLDIVVAILAMGLYPNVCCHKEKRKVIITEGKIAQMEKSSVNSTTLTPPYPSPFFAFGEKIKTLGRWVKQMTMITPLHLLLFGPKEVEYSNGHVIIYEGMSVKMSLRDASVIVALKTVIEPIILQAAARPESVAKPNSTTRKILNLIQRLSDINAARAKNFAESQSADGQQPPSKSRRLRGGGECRASDRSRSSRDKGILGAAHWKRT